MVFRFLKSLRGPKKRSVFYDILEQQADKALEGLEALTRFAEEGTREHATAVTNIEREADDLRRLLVLELDKTFVTPLDREDIYELSRALDDVVDYADTTVQEMQLFEIRANKNVVEMVHILRQAAHELRDAVKHLDTQPKIASAHASQAKSYENSMEVAYHHALADLFTEKDIIYILKMREIYRHLSNGADRGDEAANIMLSIVMKHS
jgi:hypothetical protein